MYRDTSLEIYGSVLPVLIHSTKRNTTETKSAAEKRIDLYSSNPNKVARVDKRFGEGLENFANLDLKVCASTNGSMDKDIFLEVMKYFVDRQPKKFGAKGQYSFLFLDGHVSRWHPKALLLLFQNRIVPLFFPSHLSIVVQPNDNGVIYFLHKCIEDASQLSRMFKNDWYEIKLPFSFSQKFILLCVATLTTLYFVLYFQQQIIC